MFTANHNPAAYNGIKLCRAQAKPVGGTPASPSSRYGHQRRPGRRRTTGQIHDQDVLAEYSILSRSSTSPTSGRSGSPSTRATAWPGTPHRPCSAPFGLDAASAVFSNWTGPFPTTRPITLEPSNLVDLRDYVTRTGADIGLAFDGDADRCFVVDEQGTAGFAVGPSQLWVVAARELFTRTGRDGDPQP